jgi:hypothetical protein
MPASQIATMPASHVMTMPPLDPANALEFRLRQMDPVPASKNTVSQVVGNGLWIADKQERMEAYAAVLKEKHAYWQKQNRSSRKSPSASAAPTLADLEVEFASLSPADQARVEAEAADLRAAVERSRTKQAAKPSVAVAAVADAPAAHAVEAEDPAPFLRGRELAAAIWSKQFQKSKQTASVDPEKHDDDRRSGKPVGRSRAAAAFNKQFKN